MRWWALRLSRTTTVQPTPFRASRPRDTAWAMSQENVEIVQRIFDRWQAGDLALDAFDAEVEWDASHMPDGETYRGREGVSRYLRRFVGTWDNYELILERLIDAGDDVVAFTVERGRGRGSGIPIVDEGTMLFSLGKGTVVRWKGFHERDGALEAVGLSE
jgi:ketosteroid isomerase-like protein